MPLELFLPSEQVWCTAATVEVAAASLLVDGLVVACLGAFFCGGASGFGEQRTDADVLWCLDSALTRSFDFIHLIGSKLCRIRVPYNALKPFK
jgi:hypothetical protein